MADQNDGWETVDEPVHVVTFDEDGDQLIGTYMGKVTIVPPGAEENEDDQFRQDRFRWVSGTADIAPGEIAAINSGYMLRQALDKVTEGSMTRVTRVGTQDTGQPSPMVLFRVDVKN